MGQEIRVDSDGKWEVVRAGGGAAVNTQVDFSCAAHDTTGGVETKVRSAANIAACGVDVFIVKAGSEHAVTAMQIGYTEGWVGTWLRPCTSR